MSLVRHSFSALALSLGLAANVTATPFTLTSPTGGMLPSGVTEIGGIVTDLIGLNGTRIVAQLSASSLFVGAAPAGQYPLLIGTQAGFSPAVVGALGGGIASASFRVTVFDGDNASGDFDFNNNSLLVNNLNFGNLSAVATQETNSTGNTAVFSDFGFGDETLMTGFFSSTNAALLATLFTSLSAQSIEFRLADTDPGDQFYDFRQGVDGGLINIGSGPVVTPPGVPELTSTALVGLGLLCFGWVRSRSRR